MGKKLLAITPQWNRLYEMYMLDAGNPTVTVEQFMAIYKFAQDKAREKASKGVGSSSNEIVFPD